MKNDSHIVSVVIPTIGRSTVNLCKDALEKQTRSPDEVIIIKDHESDAESVGQVMKALGKRVGTSSRSQMTIVYPLRIGWSSLFKQSTNTMLHRCRWHLQRG